jgi:hypothetical protein
MHGIPDGDWIQMESKIYKYSDKYEGYLSSHDGPLQSDDELNVVYNKIIN